MSKKKNIFIVMVSLIFILIIASLLFYFYKKNQNKAVSEEQIEDNMPVAKKRLTAPLNLLSASQRPFVSLKPFTKSGGRFVSIELQQQIIPAKRAEYEVVYNIIGASAVDAKGQTIKLPAGEEEGGMQAFMGELDLSTLPTKTENRFGTCSAGGACINNNVSDGALILTFDTSEKYSLSSQWTYFEKGEIKSQTHDQVFTLTSSKLSSAKDYLLMSMMGLPEGLSAKVATQVDEGKDNGFTLKAYQINFSQTFTKTTAQVDFSDASPSSQLAVWDGTSWQEMTLADEVPLGDGYIYALLAD